MPDPISDDPIKPKVITIDNDEVIQEQEESQETDSDS